MSEPELPAKNLGTDIAESMLNPAMDVITGLPIPGPVKRNALKAFGRLCSAAIEIPSAYLEGVAAEKRAIAEARVKLIETNAAGIARKINVDEEYARIAVLRYGKKILREQVNLDLVSEAAAYQLKGDEDTETSKGVGQINDDWLNHFEKEACQRSSEDMQQLFGKILAGEIRRPSSFSIKALKIMGDIDQVAASLFKRLCSICIVFRNMKTHKIVDAFVISLSGNAAHNALSKYGLGFDELNILHEYGLIISDYNSYYNIIVEFNKNVGEFELIYQETSYDLLPAGNQKDRQPLKLEGVRLSKAGKELVNVVGIQPIEIYTRDLANYFAKKKLKMIPIS